MYDKELYHSYDNEWVPRTNDDEEDFNRVIKRPIRKQMGRKDSWFYVEHQGEGVTFLQNLVRCSHIVGGTSISTMTANAPWKGWACLIPSRFQRS